MTGWYDRRSLTVRFGLVLLGAAVAAMFLWWLSGLGLPGFLVALALTWAGLALVFLSFHPSVRKREPGDEEDQL